MKKKNILIIVALSMSLATPVQAIDHPGITHSQSAENRFTLIDDGRPNAILIDETENIAVKIAAENLQKDFQRVSGQLPVLVNTPQGKRMVVVGTAGSKLIRQLVKEKKLNITTLKGKCEMYLMTTVKQPFAGVEEALVIVGSDRRGAVYGIYELSEQIGVSPWYDWADVPVEKQKVLAIDRGSYTAGEPAVRYRGIFLNDEAPCLTSWVKNTYGTGYGDHRFYARVFELLLRLRANFMWPAMWGWSFYADDPLNSKTADDMGIIMGTSHHEPMARNHQEWARNRRKYGVWDYATNQEVIDRFFREGIERAKNTEDLITIGMRGDGDAPMGGEEGKDHEFKSRYEANMALMERIFTNQRRIIKEVTGEKPEKRPQVWAIYKEVQTYYDMGLRVPDDVIMLVCDDNWGNVRRLPNAEERKHKGGWGMYYHVDYVGAPRNTKWLNVTPVQNLWEQMQLTYEYGVDKLWILNVGDLKPMEYPITLFLNMAWNPRRYEASTLMDHPRAFCAQQLGEDQADEAARILNLYSKYAGRVTPEMLDMNTYNLATGEWKKVSDDLVRLEAEALRQYLSLKPAYQDTYRQLILFPVQALSNLYEMYYAQAMNHKLAADNNPQANYWADRVEQTFNRDAQLCHEYNKVMAGGKWDGMMTQKHIGYTSWNDNFPKDIMPKVRRVEQSEEAANGGYFFTPSAGYISIEAEHYFESKAADGTQWTIIPYLGRTLSGVALMPYINSPEGASLSYRMQLPKEAGNEVTVHVVVKSTLAFSRKEGHRYTIGFEGADAEEVNFNANLNEDPQNCYTVFYPTVARRVIENKVKLRLPHNNGGQQTLVFRPLDPGVVLEKIVVDYGGYQPSYLFMDESPCRR